MYGADSNVLVSDYVCGYRRSGKTMIKQCYKWKKINMSVRSWPKELNEELCNIRLAFV